MTCNEQRQCTCKNGYKGIHCDLCEDEYYMLANGTCQSKLDKQDFSFICVKWAKLWNAFLWWIYVFSCEQNAPVD